MEAHSELSCFKPSHKQTGKEHRNQCWVVSMAFSHSTEPGSLWDLGNCSGSHGWHLIL
jgi:hypothetical protein